MSSNSGITEERVFESADQLLALGQAPTLKLIRDDLKTGSFTTISNHLAKWKKMKLEHSPTPQPPSEFQSSSMKIWETAYREAEKLFSNERDIFESKNTKWQEEKVELLSIIEKQEQEGEVTQAREAENQKALSLLRLELETVRDSLTKVSTQYEATELRRLETLERADRLEVKLTELLKLACLSENEKWANELEGNYLKKNRKEVEIVTG